MAGTMMRRQGEALASAILGALFLAACSQPVDPGDASPRGDEAANAAQDDEVPADRMDELDAVMGRISTAIYGTSDPVRVEIQLRDALELGAQACMKDHGWDYAPVLADAEQVRTDLLLEETGSELADSSLREREGYGVAYPFTVGLPAEQGNPEQTSIYEALTPEEEDVYNAQLTECDTVAREQTVLGSDTFEELTQVRDEAYRETLGDPRLADAEDRWRSCMQGHGLGFDSPQAIKGDFEERARELLESDDGDALQALFDEEIEVARKDWECQAESTVPTWLTIRAEVEEVIIDENPDLLAEVRAEVKRAIGS